MSGLRPFFLTGANAKIRVNGRTLAFCTDLSYSINVNHATPRVLGMYEPTSVEPLSYIVTGSFSIIRYVADVKSIIGGESPASVNESGNGIGAWKSPNGRFSLDTPDGQVKDSLIPAKLDKSTMFEIHVLQKLPDGSAESVAKIRDARITRSDFSLSKRSAATQTFQFTAIYADEDSFLADFSGLGQQFQ